MGLLSWWRGRGDATASPGTPRTDTTAAAPAPIEAPVREAPAWPHMPPVQRTLSEPGLTIDPNGFQGALTTRQDTVLSTPLGHVVDPEAPSGLGHGLAEPVASRTHDAHSPASPEQRNVEFPTPPPVVTLQRATPSTMIESAHAAPPMHVPYAPPPAGGFEQPPQGRTGESPGETAGPEHSVEAIPLQSVQTAPPLSAPDAPEGPADDTSPGTDSGSAVRLEPPGAPASPAMPVQRARSDSIDTPMTFRPGAHGERRTPLGLGAPLSDLPPTAQRTAAARSGPEAPPPVPDASEAPPSTADGDSEGTSEALPVAPLLGDAPPPPSLGEPRDAADDPGGTEPGGDGTRLQRATRPARPEVTPLPPASPHPVAPLVAQRTVTLYSGAAAPGGTSSDASTGVGRSGTGPVDAPVVVPVRWKSPQAPGGAVQRSVGSAALPAVASAPRGGVGQDVPSPRATHPIPPTASAVSLPGPGGPGPGPSVQRSIAPAPGTLANAGDVAVASGVGRRAADGSVVFDHLVAVQREEEGETGIPPEPAQAPVLPEPPVAAQGEQGPPPYPGSPDGDAPDAPEPPGDENAANAGQPGDGRPPVVSDELVRALYSPLSRMLRAELRLERERAGFLIDTRH